MTLDRKVTFSQQWMRYTRVSLITVVVFVTCGLLSLARWMDAVEIIKQEEQELFLTETGEDVELIQERMATYEQVLRGVKGLFIASEDVSRVEFRDYTNELELQEHFPGILGVAFSRKIAREELDNHIADIQAQGFPFYTVSPEGDREIYTAITLIEPFSGGNLNAFGFDMYSEAVRREAMDRAQVSGDAALSGKVSLVQDINRGSVAGVLLYLPIYQAEISRGQVDREDLFGWAYSPFSMDILMQGLQVDESEIQLAIYDGQEIAADALLYTTEVSVGSMQQAYFERTEEIEIAGRIWTVVFAANNSFVQEHENVEPEIVLFLGGLLTILMTLLVWSLSSRREKAEARAEEMNSELLATEFRWKSALSGAGHGVWDWNNQTGEVNYNAGWKAMLGYEESELDNTFQQWQDLLHPIDRERAVARVYRFIKENAKQYSDEFRMKTRDGSWRWILSRGAVVKRGADGKPERTIGTHTDITVQKNLELALQESDQRFRGAFETAAIGMALVGLDGKWIEVNESLAEMLGYTDEELMRLSFQRITHPADLSLDLEFLQELNAGKIPSYQMEKRYFRKDGSIIWARLSVSMVKDMKSNPLHYVAQIENITERKQLQEKVLYQASHDELTGLPNRRVLQERLAHTLAVSRRHQRSFALMFIDVDFFKQVNDEHGHEAGDELLKWVAFRLKECIRASDTLVRQGGDEFVAVLTEIKAPENATLVARKMLNAISEGLKYGDITIPVSLSIGVAVYEPGSADTDEAMLKKADMALYQVKREGRNDFRLYQPEQE